MGLCLLVGAADGGVAAGGLRAWYPSLTRPPGTPPDWVFGPVWTTLHVMMGVAGWLVWRRVGGSQPTRLWGWQLLLNALWTPAFFGLHSTALGLVVILLLMAAIALTIHAFARVRALAAWLMAPYFAWICYATYLNAGFWWLNR